MIPILRRLGVWLIGGAALLTAAAAVTDNAHWFTIRSDPQFADARRQLQVLVDSDGDVRVNHFCLVGQRIGRDRQAYVYWSDRQKLIVWEPQIDNPRAIAGARRYLDLRTDVAGNNDVAGSSYRVTRRFVDATIVACHRIGTQFVIMRADGLAPRG